MIKRAYLAAFTLSAGAAVAALAVPAAAQQRDWTRTVVATPEGGFRIGNPAAKVKLIEYASLTCPHCARFDAEATAPISAMVKTGRVSFEYRTFVLNGIDVTATLLARCGGPSKFFPIAHRMFATQKEWTGKISGMPQAQKDQLKGLATGQMLARMADYGGLTQIAAQGGVTPAQGKACLADAAALARLDTISQGAASLGINSTPSFLINGALVHAHSWGELQPLIKRAGG